LLAIYSGVFIGTYFIIYEQSYRANFQWYYQVIISRLLVVTMVFHLVLVLGVKWKDFVQMVRQFFSEKGSSVNLSLFRFVIFWRFGMHFLFYCSTTGSSWASLPYSQRVSLPFLGWLIKWIPIDPQLYEIACIIAGISCLLIAVGFFSRLFLVMLIPFAFYCLGVPVFFGKINHSHIILWVIIIFCYSPVDDALSIKQWIRKRKFDGLAPPDDVKYMLPFKILWLQLSIIYFFAGFVKLWDSGLDWALSDSVIYQMQNEWAEHYDKVPAFRIDRYPWLVKLGGLATIYFELLYIFLILRPKSRIWAFISAFSFHKITGYFFYIDFTELRLVHFSYIPWNKFINFIRNRKASSIDYSTIPSESTKKSIGSSMIKFGFLCGVLLLLTNFMFSFFRIHSYPFSSYPTYSGLFKNEFVSINMIAYNGSGDVVDVMQQGKDSKFRWESIRPYELEIIRFYNEGSTQTMEEKMQEYWLIWTANIPNLKGVVKVEMFKETTELAPEKRLDVIKRDSLGTIYPGM